METKRLPTLFISHGAGPWPWMQGRMLDAHVQLARALQCLPGQISQSPIAVLVVSAHWEAPEFTAMTNPHPPMVYDYSGFPPDTYSVKYDAPGGRKIVEAVRRLMSDAGMVLQVDPARGFDHGTFVPMSVIYPKADIPILQMSLKEGLDPAEHMALGRALAPLRDDGVLIVGSGSSAHNLKLLGDPESAKAVGRFDEWVRKTLVSKRSGKRSAALEAWEAAPEARLAHPREEHLLPLMVAVGAAEDDPGTCNYHEPLYFNTAPLSNFRFG